MKYRILWGFSIGVLLAVAVQAQTVDEIIQNNIKARGGYKKLRSIKTLSSFGTYAEFDATGKTLYKIEARSDKQPPYKKRASWSAEGIKGAEGYDGVNPPWEFNFISGKGKLSNPEGAKATMRGISIVEPFIDYKQKGNKVELVGKETLEGKEVYLLRVVLQDGLVQSYYLDAKTYLVFAKREATPLHAQGDPIDSITFFDDYRPVAGFLFYFRHFQKNMKTGAKMAEGIDTKIEANLRLNKNWFSTPVPNPALSQKARTDDERDDVTWQ